jgi:polyribonucleotide nucleotidyltransferase
LDDKFVGRVEDVVKVGDKLQVKVIAIDEHDRIKLSRKALLRESRPAGEPGPAPVAAAPRQGGERGERSERGDRGERGERRDRGDRGERRDRGDRGERVPRDRSTGGEGGE